MAPMVFSVLIILLMIYVIKNGKGIDNDGSGYITEEEIKDIVEGRQ